MSGVSLVPVALAAASALGSGLWLRANQRRRPLVAQQARMLLFVVPFLCIGAILAQSVFPQVEPELRLLRMMLGVAIGIEAVHASRLWMFHGAVRTSRVVRWSLRLVPTVFSVAALAVGCWLGVFRTEAVAYDWAIPVAVFSLAVGLLAAGTVYSLPKMSPNDVVQHLPWSLATALTVTLLAFSTEHSPGWLVSGSCTLLAISSPALARLTDYSARYDLTVERAGSDSVVALRDALFLLQPNGLIDYANPAAERLIGGEVRGVHIQRICPDWPIAGRTSVVRVDATRVPVVLGKAPLLVDGDKVGVAVTATDVSELEQALAAADQARSMADKAARSRQEFLAVMSHEIRTPLHAVLGLANLLRDTRLEAQQLEWVQTICDSSDALLTILNDALDFSRIESGRLQLERISVAPERMMRGLASVVEGQAEVAGLEVVLETHVLPAWIEGDPTRLRQILLNLLSNAIKFTETGSVTMRAVHVDGWLRVSVTDTGIGIAPERVTQLFNPFVQADLSTTRRFGGTGLGLSISRRLAELMDGTLEVESVVGEGSTFTLAVPAPVVEPPREDTVELVPVVTDELHILVVDDNPVNQMVMQAILRRAGMEPELAASGTEGVKKALEGSFDLVFMDLQMPDMDGWQAIGEIAAALGEQRPFLVSHSAGINEDDAARARMAGAHAHLPKPARPPDVLAVIRLALERMDDPEHD